MSNFDINLNTKCKITWGLCYVVLIILLILYLVRIMLSLLMGIVLDEGLESNYRTDCWRMIDIWQSEKSINR